MTLFCTLTHDPETGFYGVSTPDVETQTRDPDEVVELLREASYRGYRIEIDAHAFPHELTETAK